MATYRTLFSVGAQTQFSTCIAPYRAHILDFRGLFSQRFSCSMDPATILSTVSNGFQLTQLALKVLNNLFTYYKDVCNAPHESKELRDELHTFVDILIDVESSLDADIPQNIENGLRHAHDLLEKLESRTSPGETKGFRRLMWPFQQRENKKIIDNIRRTKSDLSLVVGTQSLRGMRRIERQVTEISHSSEELKSSDQKRRMAELLDWLCPDDINQRRDQATYRELRTEGTGKWIFDQDQYKEWLKPSCRFLWISGKLGAGKSVLMSSIVDKLQGSIHGNDGCILTWFYCDGRSEGRKTEPRYIFGSLYRQFLESLDETRYSGIVKHLEDLKQFVRNDSESNIAPCFLNNVVQLCQVFRKVMYILVDGIDESPDARSISQLLVLFETHCEQVKILVTCRPEREIESVFTNRLRIEMTEGLIEDDLKTHLEMSLNSDDKLKAMSQDTKREIREHLLKSHGGMFNWVQRILDELKLLDRDSTRLEALKDLPPDLPRAYKRILDRVSERRDSKTLARQALAWLLYCKYPLKLDYLATAACINPSRPFTEDQRVNDSNSILEICRSLICAHPETKVVELCHFSVTQFLKSPTMPDGSDNIYYLDANEGNALLMKACFMYLRSPRFVDPLLSTVPGAEMLSKLTSKLQDRFTFYPIWNWAVHAKALEEGTITKDIYNFLTGEWLGAWIELWELEELRDHHWWEESEEDIRQHCWSQKLLCKIKSDGPGRSLVGGPLYYASLLGFPSVVRELLENENPNTLGGPHFCPLLAALSNGHVEVAKFLVKAGADVNIRDECAGNTCLHKAIREGNYDVAKFLVESGADLTVRNDRGVPPLHVAVAKFANDWNNAGKDWVELLATKQPNAKDQRGRTALHTAVSLKSSTVVSLLLENGADVNALDNNGRSPGHVYAEMGKDVSMFETLQNYQIDMNMTDKLGYTILHLAVRHGHCSLVEDMLGRSLGLSSDEKPPEDLRSELASSMASLYSDDLLYQNILAEVYFEDGRFDEALRLFTNVVWRDEQNRNTREVSKFSHRAFCRECFSQIIGTREKCTNKACRCYDWCTKCMSVKMAVQATCAQERQIKIPENMVKGLTMIFETKARGVQYKRVVENVSQQSSSNIPRMAVVSLQE